MQGEVVVQKSPAVGKALRAVVIASVDLSGSALVVSAARAAAYFGWRAGAVPTMRSSARWR